MATSSERGIWAQLSEEIAAATARAGRSVVAVHGRGRHASSGVVWKPNVVVTADHAIRREGELNVILEGGKTVDATLAGRDPSTDLAVVRLSTPTDLPPLEQAPSPQFQVGRIVVAVARSRRGNVVASSGILSGVMGSWRTWRGGEIDRFIRPDLTMYPGFSGGALIDSSGQGLGINTAALRRGTCITLPSSTVSRVVDELLEKGHVARPYLGLAMQPVQIAESLRGKLNLSTQAGLLVVHVEPESPADRAGVLVGDILLGISGKDAFDLREQLHSKRVGEEIDLSILRGGARISIGVSVGERPVG